MRWTRLATVSLLIAGALAAGGAVVTDRIAAARETRAEADQPPEGEFIEVDGRRIHAVTTGTGPDLVLIHGAGGSARDFTFDLVDRLKDRYRVTAFDRPGMGWSERTDPAYGRAFAGRAETPGEQAGMLSRAAAKMGITNPVVVGHSFGGIVAMAWALDHDPAAVVMLAGVANPWPGDLHWIYRVNGTPLGGALLVPLISAFTPDDRVRSGIGSTFAPQPMPAGYDTHLGPDMVVRRGVFRANTRQVNTLRPHVVEMQKRYDTLTLPIEIVHGDADRTVPLSIHSGPLSERLDNANLTVLEGVGHMPHHADPDAVIAAIDRAAARAGLH